MRSSRKADRRSYPGEFSRKGRLRMNWGVVQTQPNRERLANEQITRQGFVVWWPRVAPSTSLFPRYMFVSIDRAWSVLLSTRGVSTVLRGTGGEIATLRTEELARIRELEGEDGLIDLPPAPPRYAPQQKLLVTGRGPYAGQPCLFQEMCGPERVAVLMSLLGRSVRVVLPEYIVSAA